MSLAELDEPVRHFFEQLEPLAAGTPDVDAIGRLLVRLAGDEEYGAYLQSHLPLGAASGLHLPERGPRLFFARWTEGQVAPIHSHKTWLAITPVAGTETHRHYAVKGSPAKGTARASLAEERHLHRGDVVTLVPPEDVHTHGHVVGEGDPAAVYILTGDDQFLYEREEYDPETGACTILPAGVRTARELK
jgi:hypothetical protein